VDSIELNRHLLAIAILLAWFELVLLYGATATALGSNKDVQNSQVTFLNFMVGYFALILAFFFSFYILIQKDLQVDDAVLFTHPFISIVKIISCTEVN